MRTVKKILLFFVISNLLVALSSTALYVASMLLLENSTELSASPFVAFFGTWLVYSLHRLYKLREVGSSAPDYQTGTLMTVTRICTLLAFLGLCLCLPILDWTSLMVLAFGGLIARLYVTGLPQFGFKPLRTFAFAKGLVIASIWTLVTAIVPMMVVQSYKWMHVTERFFFLLAVALPFDIRDMTRDRADGLNTLPVILGEKRSLIISYFSLLIFMIICFFEFKKDWLTFDLVLIYLASAILTAIFIRGAKRDGSLLYYGFALDGSNLLQGVLIVGYLLLIGKA